MKKSYSCLASLLLAFFGVATPSSAQVPPGTEAVVGIESFDEENPVTSLDGLTTGYYILFNANQCANYQRGGYICYEARATDRPLRCGTEESGSGDTKVGVPVATGEVDAKMANFVWYVEVGEDKTFTIRSAAHPELYWEKLYNGNIYLWTEAGGSRGSNEKGVFTFDQVAIPPIENAFLIRNADGQDNDASGTTKYLHVNAPNDQYSYANISGWGVGNLSAETLAELADPTKQSALAPLTFIPCKPLVTTLYTINYTCNFFDGTSDEPAAPELLPDAVAESNVVSLSVGINDSVAPPAFDHSSVRSVTLNGEEFPLENGKFWFEESLLTNGELNLTVDYTADPAILFHCTLDASMFGPNDIPENFIFEDTGTSEKEVTVRIPAGQQIVAPTLANATALTTYDEIATVSTTKEASYRPWRRLYLEGVALNADGSIPDLNDATYLYNQQEVFVDIDSLLEAPNMEPLYTYNAEQTKIAAEGLDQVDVPSVITADNIYDGMYVTLFYDLKLPFKTTEVTADGNFPDDAAWYIMYINGNKVVTGDMVGVNFGDGTTGALFWLQAFADIVDNTLWCFRDNGDGTYSIFNKANPGKVMAFDGVGPAFVTATGAEAGYQLISLGDAYGFYDTATPQWLLNDNGGQGILYYANPVVDPSSQFTFEEYVAENYTFLDGRSALNGVNCINGYTEDQVAEMRGYIEAGDLSLEQDITDMVLDLVEAPADELIQHNPANGYAIISAATPYISRGNVKYALYLDGEGILSWKEFNQHDKNFYFELSNYETLANEATGADSIVSAFKSIATGAYVDASAWTASQPLGSSAEYNAESMRFHLAPAVAEYDADGDMTVSAVPAAFYVERKAHDGGNPEAALTQFTMSMHSGAITDATSGRVLSNNAHGKPYANVFRFWDGGPIPTVGIGSVTNDEAVDGTKSDAIYDLSGRRVQKAVKGIYIQSGKKVYVK